MKLRNIYKIFSRVEEKNIKSMLNDKGKIYIDINTILNEFESLVNDSKIVEERIIDNKFYEILGKNDEEQILKMFNFIEIIFKLENNSKVYADQIEKFNQKLKHEVDLFLLNQTINIGEKYNEEISRLQRKVIDQKLQREEIENSMLYMKQLNKDLEAKIFNIEQENINLKKSFKIVNDKIPEIDFLKTKIENKEKEVNYKDSIIHYFENILKENKSKIL